MSTTSSLEGNYSPPSPLELQYGDATSSIYPDRPIHPLPKRRLRSRLSPGAANSIQYPRDVTSSIVSTQSTNKSGRLHFNGDGDGDARHPSSQQSKQETESYQFRGSGMGGEVVNGHRQGATLLGIRSGTNGHLMNRPYDSGSYKQAYMPPPIPPSAASSGDSVDGYDSFENTNNKKKRKIPISGSLGNHHSSLSTEMAHMDISSTRDIDVSQNDPDVGVGQYYGSGSSALAASSHGSGISGSGRGRFGRSGARRHSGRSPLGVSFNGTNTTLPGRTPYNNRDASRGFSSPKSDADLAQTSDQGIISAAIANAAALPTTPIKGQEHLSLLEQQSLKKSGSPKTQFTFTCKSDSAKSMAWPGYGYSLSNDMHDETPSARSGDQGLSKVSKSTQGTQTSPSMADQTSQHPQSNTHQQAPQQPRKPRRSLAKQLAIAARDRRLAQDYENYNNPPKPDKVWVCDFCEYEMIFGEPPAALIRHYETKDRRERRQLAEKRRLLEKAKMKSRKGKKGNKNSKTQNATQQHPQSQKMRYDTQAQDQAAMRSQGTQSDEQILEDYEDDPYDPLPPEAMTRNPSKIPQPVGQAQNYSLRPTAGAGIGTSGSAGRAA